jgi:hypothetical protein
MASVVRWLIRRQKAASMFDQQISALASFVAYLEVVDERGEETNRQLALDVIEDIITGEFTSVQTLDMIKTVMDVARDWELDDNARHELDTTRAYLAQNRG